MIHFPLVAMLFISSSHAFQQTNSFDAYAWKGRHPDVHVGIWH